MTAYERYAPFRTAIGEVMDPRFYTLAWLDEEVRSGRAKAFTTQRSAVLATVKDYPTGARELHGLVAVGGMDEIVPLIADAEDWGRRQGCSVVVIASREGWVRQMRGFGYQPYQTAVMKEL